MNLLRVMKHFTIVTLFILIIFVKFKLDNLNSKYFDAKNAAAK